MPLSASGICCVVASLPLVFVIQAGTAALRPSLGHQDVGRRTRASS